MELRYQERICRFRSPGVVRFVDLLRQASPNWVDLADIRKIFPGIAPRQLARFVAALDQAGLPLIHYETKTRGRYRLAVPADSLSVVPRLTDQPAAGPQPGVASPREASLATYLAKEWVDWSLALVRANQAVNDGHLAGPGGGLDSLAEAAAAASRLPAWTGSVVAVRRAHVLERLSRYRDAAASLRQADTALRHGDAHPGVGKRMQLVRAKIRYDQGRYDAAESCLAAARGRPEADGPNWLNMRALLSGRKLLTAGPDEAPQLLASTLADLGEALGHVFLGNGDSSLLDALCFNFGNNLLRGIQRGLLPSSSADVAMQWLAANQLVCRKLGIGEDSILINLLLIDVGLDYGYSIDHWPPLLKGELNNAGDLGKLLADTLAQARQTGNRLEIVECLHRQILLAANDDTADQAYQEAAELCGELGRHDQLNRLTADWKKRSINQHKRKPA